MWCAHRDVAGPGEPRITPLRPTSSVRSPCVQQPTGVGDCHQLAMPGNETARRKPHSSPVRIPGDPDDLPRRPVAAIACAHADGAVAINRVVLDHPLSRNDGGHVPGEPRLQDHAPRRPHVLVRTRSSDHLAVLGRRQNVHPTFAGVDRGHPEQLPGGDVRTSRPVLPHNRQDERQQDDRRERPPPTVHSLLVGERGQQVDARGSYDAEQHEQDITHRPLGTLRRRLHPHTGASCLLVDPLRSDRRRGRPRRLQRTDPARPPRPEQTQPARGIGEPATTPLRTDPTEDHSDRTTAAGRSTTSITTTPQVTLCGCCTCPRCDSNAHWTDFESAASADWATGAGASTVLDQVARPPFGGTAGAWSVRSGPGGRWRRRLRRSSRPPPRRPRRRPVPRSA